MKKLIFFIATLQFLIEATAQVTNTRTAKPDTGKHKTVPTAATTRVASIPGLKTAGRGIIIDSRRQVAILGLDTGRIHYSDDPKYYNMIKELLKKKAPVEQNFTPARPCPDQNNCIFYNNTVTEFASNYQHWAFLRDETDVYLPVLKSAVIKFRTTMKTNKRYLLTFNVFVESTSPNVLFEIVPVNKNGIALHVASYNLYAGNNQFNVSVYPRVGNNSPNLEQTDHYLIQLKFGETIYDKYKKFRVFMNSIRVQEFDYINVSMEKVE